jgi:carboxymethylenebutenolidase
MGEQKQDFEHKVEAGWVTFKSGADDIRGYLAIPHGVAKAPAIVVAHENLGVIPHRQEATRRYAAQGFVVMTVDLYSRIGGKPPFGFEHPDPEERRSGAFLASRDEQSVPDLEAARRYLCTRPEVDAERIGTLGYCLGGGPSLVWATQSPDLKACVILYALPILPPHYTPDQKPRSRIDIADQVRCPVQCHFGDKDEVIPLDQVRSLDQELRKSGQPIELHVYAGAGHAFEDAGHPNHHAAAAKQVFERSVEFFRRRL